MDDNRSMLSSVYWDTRSITSDGTIATEYFHTPTGSFNDVSSAKIFNEDSLSDSESVTPQLNDEHTIEHDECEQVNSNKDIIVNEILIDDIESTPVHATPPSRPPPIKLHKSVSVQIGSRSLSPERRDWRNSISNRLLLSTSGIRQCKSDDGRKYRGVRSILLRMRNSIKRFKSFDRAKSQSLTDDSLESNFGKISIKNAGSVVMHSIEEEKSIFDQCSTIGHVFKSEFYTKLRNIPSIVDDCISSFLEVNRKQIDHRLQQVNLQIGRHFNLFSDDLGVIDKSKKYKRKPFLGSKDAYLITDTKSAMRFIALKTITPRKWISVTGFLQYLEMGENMFPNQTWVCYEADSITSLEREQDSVKSGMKLYKLILHSVLQLLIILFGSVIKDSLSDVQASRIILISAHTSLICILAEPDMTTQEETIVTSQGNMAILDMYRESLVDLECMVRDFLQESDNCYHFISASFPLDYLFYLLIELHQHEHLLDSL